MRAEVDRAQAGLVGLIDLLDKGGHGGQQATEQGVAVVRRGDFGSTWRRPGPMRQQLAGAATDQVQLVHLEPAGGGEGELGHRAAGGPAPEPEHEPVADEAILEPPVDVLHEIADGAAHIVAHHDADVGVELGRQCVAARLDLGSHRTHDEGGECVGDGPVVGGLGVAQCPVERGGDAAAEARVRTRARDDFLQAGSERADLLALLFEEQLLELDDAVLGHGCSDGRILMRPLRRFGGAVACLRCSPRCRSLSHGKCGGCGRRVRRCSVTVRRRTYGARWCVRSPWPRLGPGSRRACGAARPRAPSPAPPGS